MHQLLGEDPKGWTTHTGVVVLVHVWNAVKALWNAPCPNLRRGWIFWWHPRKKGKELVPHFRVWATDTTSVLETSFTKGENLREVRSSSWTAWCFRVTKLTFSQPICQGRHLINLGARDILVMQVFAECFKGKLLVFLNKRIHLQINWLTSTRCQ